MDSLRDRQPACGFCDGTGLWPDPDGDPDPCPLCDGAGLAPAGARGERPPSKALLARVQALIPRLSQAERQRIYEELHARWDCRIYRY